MNQFGIIGALRTYAQNLGMLFVWGIDEYYRNIATNQQIDASQLIMVVDLRPNPTFSGTKVSQITYSGLVMLGQKKDADGLQASLDETPLQKYDRRLEDLQTSLAVHLATFACDNNLDLIVGEMDFAINLYDTNIDFIAAENVIFVQ